MPDVNHALRETAYVAVGLGVLGFQRLQVQRVELTKELQSQMASIGERVSAELGDSSVLRQQLTDLARSVDEATSPIRHQLDDQIGRFTESLPRGAREAVASVRAAASAQEQALRDAIGLG